MSRHKTISFIKSGVRLLGYVALPFSLWVAATLLFFSELLGVWEEVGEA